MQLPTNYKMGTGLAATIMGSQAGLEQEKMGLENLYKGMQMPGEILKGQEQAMLLQDPRYLQQKTANTLIDLGNQHDASEFQQSLNAFGRVKIQLQAASGDPQKQQQIVLDGLKQLNMDPNSEFGRYALANPDAAIDKLIQGTEAAMARAGGAKQAGAMQLQGVKEAGDDRRAQLLRQNQLQIAQLHESGQNARHNQTLGTDKLLGEMIKKANAGDADAMAWVNTYTQIQRAKNPAFGGMTLNPQGGMTTKGELSPLPFAQKKVINLDETK